MSFDYCLARLAVFADTELPLCFSGYSVQFWFGELLKRYFFGSKPANLPKWVIALHWVLGQPRSLTADVAVQTTSEASNPGGILTRCHGRLLAPSLPSSRVWPQPSLPAEETLFFLLDLCNALIKVYAPYSNLDFPFNQHCTSCQALYSLVNKFICWLLWKLFWFVVA